MTLQTGKNGFTFTELLVVISIILVITASVLTVIPRLSRDTQVKVARTMIDRLEMAIEHYYDDNRFYPSGDIENLRSLLQSSDTTFKQYIEFNDEETSGNTIIDVWGNSLVYISPGNQNTSSYDLYSTGPDGTSTTTGSDIDDINNWSR
ncbi:MAG: type II secretion system protein GspG [Candidatus Scalindua sp.]|nr:type II secretion system protein GspG [Candidatus Scalindua sp.]